MFIIRKPAFFLLYIIFRIKSEIGCLRDTGTFPFVFVVDDVFERV